MTAVMSKSTFQDQQVRNRELIEHSRYMRTEVDSQVLPLSLRDAGKELSAEQAALLQALAIEAARVAIASVGSLAKLNEVDHLGGGLDLIPALMMTLAHVDHEKVGYTIEHAHTSIGYYAALAVLGYLDPQAVIDEFRRGLDIPGHVSYVPGGTEMNGGRLGVMVPAAVGAALGMKAHHGAEAWMLCHCGDAGWISGQALNGFNAADLHGAPITFVMHRNGVQLSGSTAQIMDKDPRPIIASLGIEIIETPSLVDPKGLHKAYGRARELARQGRPSMIYPVGYKSEAGRRIDLNFLGDQFGIQKEVAAFAAANGVETDREIWIPGSLMSFGDVQSMLECVFLTNNLPGGKGHHDGHMKGRSVEAVLASPMLALNEAQTAALEEIHAQPRKTVKTTARPAPGTANLVVPPDVIKSAELAGVGKSVSPRLGTEAAYAAVAKTYPEAVFVVSCDLDPSTRLEKARSFLKPDHQFELSIEEQVASLIANGLAVSSRRPQLNVFSTFAAFFEGIAREGFEMWRYQRNLNGVNEGLNVDMHLSHVGACTGRDHFSGWSLNWINLALDMLPHMHRFYAPADVRAAYLAGLDLAAHYGGHIIGVPRDNLPVLAAQDGQSPLWDVSDPFESVTVARSYEGARRAILAMGAPAFLAIETAEALSKSNTPTDVLIINALPLDEGTIQTWTNRYPEGLVTVEDGIIGGPATGLRGFAGLVATESAGKVPLGHVGITDPRIAPSEGHMEVWAHFGITADALLEAVKGL